MQEIIINSIPVFIGAGLAFLLNYFHEQEKIKEKEIMKSRKFLSRLYTVTDASYNFYLKHKIEIILKEIKRDNTKEIRTMLPIILKKIKGKPCEKILKSLPPRTTNLIPSKTPLKASEVSFCARSNKHKDFLSDAFMYELDVERVNSMIEKQSELALEIEKEIQNYIGEQEVEEPISVFDLNFEEILGYRKATSYKFLCEDIIEVMPSIYIQGMELQKKHREIMQELYPREKIREFNFRLGNYEDIIKIEKDRLEKRKEFYNEIEELIKDQLNYS